MTLDEFNSLSEKSCQEILSDVCHSHRWAKLICAHRPFTNLDQLLLEAQDIWVEMDDDDILESFKGHARIGDLSALRDKYSAASAEQGQVSMADDLVLEDLMRLNKEYEEKNGFIFIVCATGKSAEEMRDLLLDRISNSRDDEILNGGIEQSKITQLRLKKLLIEKVREPII